jgi:hypothetical protein
MPTTKAFVLAAGLSLFATAFLPAQADADSCTTTAAGKKLAGAAMTSFMKKCQSDAAKTCDATAADKKLAGAAKSSFTKKCVSDAVGT